MIEHLENGDPSQRKQADRLLIQEGGAAMAALRAALAGPTTPGQRTRLRSVIAAVKGAAALQGPLISIRLSKVPLDIAFARICEKVGIHASPYAGYADRKPMLVTLQVNRRPFWDVMQRLALSSGYSPSYGTMTSPSGGSLLYAQPGLLSKANLTSRYKGFMIAAQSIGRSSSEQLGGINAGTFFRSLDVGLAVLPPPYRNYKIKFAQPRVVQATDSLHQSLLLHPRQRSSYFGYGSSGTLVYNLTAELRYPPHIGSQIALLRGYIPTLLQSHAKNWTFTNLEKLPQSEAIDDFKVSIGNVKWPGGGWRMTIKATPLRSSTELATADFRNIARQIGRPGCVVGKGAHGEIIPQMNFATDQEDYRERKYTVTFFRKPKTITVCLFRNEIRLRIPFEFKGIAVP